MQCNGNGTTCIIRYNSAEKRLDDPLVIDLAFLVETSDIER